MSEGRGWPPLLAGLLFLGAGLLTLEAVYLVLLASGAAESLSSTLAEARSFVGPVWPILGTMGLLSVSSAMALLAGRLNVVVSPERLPRRLLGYVTETAPHVGLLGTFLALMRVQLSLDGEMSQSDLLTTLAQQGGQAYGSTVAAIVIALFSFTVSRIFCGDEA